MVALLSLRRKALSLIAGAVALVGLAACDVPTIGGGPLINTSRAVPVALLVPKSSASAGSLAVSLENAARLAAGDLESVEIDLRVYDTGGTAAGAAAAAEQALDDGARIFVGPLFAEAAASAGQVAAGRGVNVLAFSNNPSVAGGNVFILGNTFQTSADRLVRYAQSQGKGDIYIVHAADPAEESGRDAIQRSIAANGARLAGTSSFALSQQGVIDAIPQIANGYRSSGASAVFVTSGTSGALPFLAELLPENGVDADNAQFIGLQRLDIPTSALSLGGLQGAWFATPSPGLTARFNARYQAAYGALPSPVAGLAYDGIAAIGALVAQGNSNALTAEALTQGQGFAGVSGPFRFFRSGTNERGLAVAQIQNNQVIVIDPAPRSFGGAGL
ncbi:ABC transporter substrate-binding protein [Alphaproteobacteria bacterium GH1-50]|uniref:ABC transporter substrate-binding protein n=1 Tax=Kangsaoukella pontilimi TaxID=2691042 RepID=A0A7C9IQ00_9RHOB|nr:penicillin-binding protein activator [Kangsaoukella pontilimi]MXQ08630.1 ABC transporter substrate-binding protein [Kangsaoukella pontilimi]